MKRISNEHINNIVFNYLNKRQYSLNQSNITTPHNNNNATQQTEQTQTQTPHNRLSMEQMAINGVSHNHNSRSNSVSFCSSVCDFSLKAENAYKHFLNFISLEKRENIRNQLNELQFPFYVYIFVELFQCGYKVSARRFFREHKSKFQDSLDFKPLIDSISNSLNSQTLDANLSYFRNSKYCVKISENCLKHLYNYFKQTDDLIILQLLNMCIDIQVYHNNSENEKYEKLTNSISKPSFASQTSTISLPNLKTSSDDKESLLSCIKKVYETQYCLPSICTFNVQNPDLCSISVADDINYIAGGFENSSIKLWKFQSNGYNIVSDPDVKRKTCDINLAFIDHNADNDDYENVLENEVNANDINNQEVNVLHGHCAPVYGVEFMPKSNLLLSCSGDTTVRAWDIASLNTVSIFEGHVNPIWSLDCSDLGNNFVTGSRDGVVHLWSIERHFPLRLYSGHELDVDCVKFYPNCNFIASGSGDKTIKFWDIQQSRVVRVFQGHVGSVYSISFSPCGKYLASAGEDRKVKIWDISSGKLLKDFTGHTNTIYSICFNYNNSILASCGADRSLKLWNLQNINNYATNSSDNRNNGHQRVELLNNYNRECNLIYTQFMPHNLLLTIGNKINL